MEPFLYGPLFVRTGYLQYPGAGRGEILHDKSGFGRYMAWTFYLDFIHIGMSSLVFNLYPDGSRHVTGR